MRRCCLLTSILIACALIAGAQQVPASALDGLAWRSIGPATTGGRIADVTGITVPGEPQEMLVGTASGGVFKSENAGVSWTPIFDHSGGMMSIGAVAIAPSNPSILWVGTGEADNRQSSSWGNGIYKSLDGGASWQAMGLADTRHIARIIIDPRNPEIVYVAALGHLWGSNTERGVFKTTDGGRSWKKVLYVDDNTGATDLAMSATNPNLLLAATYQRQRKGWGFNGGGPGSGIWRSSDAGEHWTKLSKGLPEGVKGRIGVALYPGDDRIAYAIVEADPTGAGRGGAAKKPKGGIFRSLNQGESWEHMSGLDPRPMYYSRIYVAPRNPEQVYIMGSERGFHISDDGGRNFRDVFSRVHGEDHAMWIDPLDPNHLLIGGDGGVSISYDRGVSWLFRDNLPIGQFYKISVNQATPFVVCGGLQDNGNWCTPSASNLSYGLSNRDAFNVGGGDGMHAVFDGDNYTLLVSSQNGNTGRVDIRTMQRQSIGPARPQPGADGKTTPYRFNWTAPLLVSPSNPKVIYTAANRLFRSEDQGRSWRAISPDLTAAVDRDKLTMMGGIIPADAMSRNDGQDNFSALTAVAESPTDSRLLYTGADDGTFEMTRDGGGHWTNLSHNFPGLPAMTQVSGIEPSRFAAGRVYASFDGHFNDDYAAHVYVSEDYGATWQPIAGGLPTSVHVVREDPRDANFLVAGTEEGVYASWDRGRNWTSLNTDLPPVPVYDMVYAEGGRALVLGTHGRGLWVLDNTAPLVGMGKVAAGDAAALLPIAAAHRETIYSPQSWFGWGEFFAPNPPAGAVITYWLPQAVKGKATITVHDAAGGEVAHFDGPAAAGLNQVEWDLHRAAAITPPAGRGGFRFQAGGPWVTPGTYTAEVVVGSAAPLHGSVEVTADPESPLDAAGQKQRAAAVMSAYRLEQQLAPAQAAVEQWRQQLQAMRAYATAMGQEGHAALAAVEKAEAALHGPAAEFNRVLGEASGAERAMDGYEGLPTAEQAAELASAWKDAPAAIGALNRFAAASLPAAEAALAGGKWPAVKPLAIPQQR